MNYIVKKFDALRMRYNYFNTFYNYKDAAEARDELQKRFGGQFKIFEEEE